MILIDDISAYYYMVRDGVPIYSDGKPAYLDSIFDGQTYGNPGRLPESMLFDFGPEPVHLLVTDSNKRSFQGPCKYRVRTMELPPKSFIRLTDDISIASPQLVYTELGIKVPSERQIEMGDEMIGRYSLSLDEDERIIERANSLVTIEELEDYVETASNMHGIKQARSTVKLLCGISESPMETRTEMTACLPFKYGGLRLPKPILNHEIDLPEYLWDLAGRRKFRLDCYWSKQKFELEYMGKHAHPGTERKNDEDSIRDTIINYLGIDSLEITDRQARNRAKLSFVARTIEKKIGTRHYNPPSGFEARQRKLFDELYNPSTRNMRLRDLWR